MRRLFDARRSYNPRYSAGHNQSLRAAPCRAQSGCPEPVRKKTPVTEETIMSKHDEARRAFLVGTAIGAGAAASVAFVPGALAPHQSSPPAPTNTAMPDPGEHSGGGYGAWLNGEEAAAIAAFAERLMPGEPGKPGATDAGVLNYIDLALAGAYADQRDFYRRGIAQLDSYCRKTHSAPFAQLAAA